MATATMTGITAARATERAEVGRMLGMSAPASLVRAFGSRDGACGGISRAIGWRRGRPSPSHVRVARRDGRIVAACVRCDGSERVPDARECEGIPDDVRIACGEWLGSLSRSDDGTVVVPMFAVGPDGCRDGAAEQLLLSVVDEAGERPVEVEVPLGDDYAVIACLSLGFRTVRGSAGDGDGIVRMRMG